MHVAQETTHCFFHVSTREALTPAVDADWMVLLLETDQSAKTGWHGYDIRLNHTRPSADCASIESWDGKGWQTAIREVSPGRLLYIHDAPDLRALYVDVERITR